MGWPHQRDRAYVIVNQTPVEHGDTRSQHTERQGCWLVVGRSLDVDDVDAWSEHSTAYENWLSTAPESSPDMKTVVVEHG
ncbi:hypothetical protein GN244_ATG10139 [Phytophthora infestans]|uniref:Uncharacterized protein n=1 Tax=Phytophthora infestans TaxID=4787 RepID=A0A833STC9_PHYIN|nr:hypothetical protein GN244_ATG10138 [Phytophthora infestans]KAF4037810.1 hypothetical protein GN244_ATG10139 [Phytophthora infestans]KAF4146058.1 hypothetical protein GN958_ATG04724 [Phytophthora infestans]KAF4146061.1 hypothetical protein GN958_ATG04727 [Phytophthora infestans]KAF4146064.1 hypothetical protein GN958_ATG04730 [Phytophthora infestans]